MSTEEITYWGFVVPKYKKINQAIEIHLYIEHNEVLVVITTTLTKFTYVTLNMFEIYFQKYEPHCE